MHPKPKLKKTYVELLAYRRGTLRKLVRKIGCPISAHTWQNNQQYLSGYLSLAAQFQSLPRTPYLTNVTSKQSAVSPQRIMVARDGQNSNNTKKTDLKKKCKQPSSAINISYYSYMFAKQPAISIWLPLLSSTVPIAPKNTIS